jgi:hypothetical protein
LRMTTPFSTNSDLTSAAHLTAMAFGHHGRGPTATRRW